MSVRLHTCVTVYRATVYQSLSSHTLLAVATLTVGVSQCFWILAPSLALEMRKNKH